MEKLAIDGGKPTREKSWPTWPIIDEAAVQAVAEVVRGGKWSSNLGSEVREFEKAFAAYNGVRHAIAVNSGSSALQVALAALDIGAGDEVIVPTYTYVASANAALLVGATPILVDVEADTYNISPAAVEAAITPRTRAIMQKVSGKTMRYFLCCLGAMFVLAMGNLSAPAQTIALPNANFETAAANAPANGTPGGSGETMWDKNGRDGSRAISVLNGQKNDTVFWKTSAQNLQPNTLYRLSF